VIDLRRINTTIVSLIALSLLYSFFYLAHSALPGNNQTYPLGWWGWFDQSMYLRAARAFAAFDVNPDLHWYPPGFALLGAPFTQSLPGNPYFFVDLACLGAAFLGFAATARRLGVSGAWALALFLLPLTDRRLIDAWVVPWSTSPVAALLWIMLAVIGSQIAAQGPTPWRCALVGAMAALVVVFRPTDATAAFICAGVAALFDITHRRPRLLGTAAIAAGGAAVLAGAALLHWRIYGWHLSPYLAHSGDLGFYFGDLGFKLFTLLVDPQPWFGVAPDGLHQGLLMRAPWLALGFAGIVPAVMAARGGMKWLVIAMAGAILANAICYIAYTDFLPTGVWRYGNIHYLKWAYPGMALFGFVVLRELATGRRRVAGACLAGVALLGCMRLMPAPVPDGAAYRMAELGGPTGRWEDSYFNLPTLHDQLGPLPNLRAVRAVPMSGGIRVWAIRRDMAGPLAWAPEAGEGIGQIRAQRQYRAALGFGWPCFLVPRSCRPGSPIPPS
jgi:hypothetical protein